MVSYELILCSPSSMFKYVESFPEEDKCVPWDAGTWWLSLECGWAGLMHHLPRISHANTGIHWRTLKYPRNTFRYKEDNWRIIAEMIWWNPEQYCPSIFKYSSRKHCSCSQRCESNVCVVLFSLCRTNKANKPYIRTVSTLMVRGS